SVDGTFALPLGKRVSLQADTFLGGTNGDNVPYEYLFYFGGFRANYRWFFPFVGLDYMSVSGPNAFVLGGAVQFEAFNNIYLIFKTNIGKLANQFKDVFNMSNNLLGAGVTLGWDSPIGPIDLTLMKEIKKNIFVASISIGYWF
ncbi:MAG: BamA/TamA family outer membrane protein, partial [Proteobacteria bacterium]|nr:BamA/TamA family outer membrane protein [Pseudomonadota bacterium]